MISTFLLLAATYVNPVLHMDFSDPDVCIGGDGRAYLTASSFGGLPGLPILVSDDLVNWSYAGYALAKHPFPEAEGDPLHGRAVWAPSIRYRADKQEYVVYWGDPDRGIYRTEARAPEGPWSEPRLVVAGKGLIDPCPLYDDDGRIYLVNAWAASRAGFNSVLTVRELDADETRAVSEPVLVYDGLPDGNSTCEGPKFYKKDGAYWLWFPAGGVERGWQVAARAATPYGPYEARTVLAQGGTDINGPHQGAWVRRLVFNDALNEGRTEDWFVHFRDKGAYGRIVHLEPMTWADGAWPVVGRNGEPVASGEMPASVAGGGAPQAQLPFGGLAVSDEFDGLVPGLQWQFLGKSSDLAAWCTPKGVFRLYSTPLRRLPASASSLAKASPASCVWRTPNLMVQKFPAEAFTATLKARVCAKEDAEEAGLTVQGLDAARLGLRYREKGNAFEVVYTETSKADRPDGGEERRRVLATLPATVVPAGARSAQACDVWLRVSVAQGARCTFAWSADGADWKDAPGAFTAANGKWIGATVGLYALCEPGTGDRGWMDADWFRVGSR